MRTAPFLLAIIGLVTFIGSLYWGFWLISPGLAICMGGLGLFGLAVLLSYIDDKKKAKNKQDREVGNFPHPPGKEQDQQTRP